MENFNVNHVSNPDTDIFKLLKNISVSESVELACDALASFFASLGGQLLSVKFYDREDDAKAVRLFSAYPDSMLKVADDMKAIGGCPYSQEAKRLMLPFDSNGIDQSRYPSFMAKRFFNEMAQIGHSNIAVLPVMMGRGIAMVTVGLYAQPFSGALRYEISGSMPHIVAAFINRFPKHAAFFEEKSLNSNESKILSLLCQGYSAVDITDFVGLSEHTVNLIVASAKRKLNAANLPQLIYRATMLDEIAINTSHNKSSE